MTGWTTGGGGGAPVVGGGAVTHEPKPNAKARQSGTRNGSRVLPIGKVQVTGADIDMAIDAVNLTHRKDQFLSM
jgi:hypothetical protein